MKVDNFVVEVRSGGQALPEVSHGSQTFIVARPGAAFTVYVQRLDDEGDSFTECVKVSADSGAQNGGERRWREMPVEAVTAPRPIDQAPHDIPRCRCCSRWTASAPARPSA